MKTHFFPLLLLFVCVLFVGLRVIWPGVSRASGPNLWERLNGTTALSAVPPRWAGIKYLLKSSTSDKRRRLPRRSGLSRLFMLSFTGGRLSETNRGHVQIYLPGGRFYPERPR